MTHSIHFYFLTSQKAFQREMELKNPACPSPLYCVQENHFERVVRVVQELLSKVFFPLHLGHQLAKYALFSSTLKSRSAVVRFVENWELNAFLMSTFWFSVYALIPLSQFRPQSWLQETFIARDRSLDRSFVHKRFSVQCSKGTLDSLFLRNTHLKNFRRVILYTCSQDELAEGKLHDRELLTLAQKTRAHVVVYNPCGIGSSSGLFSQKGLVTSYRAMLRFIEDQKGLGAKEVIQYSRSLGVAVQLEGLRHFTHEKGVKSIVVARSPCSNLYAMTRSYYGRCVALIFKACGWSLDNKKAMRSLKNPVFILQTAAIEKGCYERLQGPAQLLADGVLEDPRMTLAHSLFKENFIHKVHLVGVKEFHDEPLAAGSWFFKKSLDYLALDICKEFESL